MKKNSAARNGRYFMPSGPIVWWTMPSSMKSTDDLDQVLGALAARSAFLRGEHEEDRP